MKSFGFGHLVSCDETFRTINISSVATQNRASKVPTTLAPLSYAKLAKVGDNPNPMLLAIISITPSRF